jgi:hypothetical protein
LYYKNVESAHGFMIETEIPVEKVDTPIRELASPPQTRSRRQRGCRIPAKNLDVFAV